jgi:hypothetical protein
MHVNEKEVGFASFVFLELVAFFVTRQQVSVVGENILRFP